MCRTPGLEPWNESKTQSNKKRRKQSIFNQMDHGRSNTSVDCESSIFMGVK